MSKRTLPNVTLRDYVQRSAFDLNLGRTHVAALVYLDLCIQNDPRHVNVPDGRSVYSNFIDGSRGLERRGLVVHHWTRDKRTGYSAKGTKAHYTITRAGQLVIELLKEAGLYDEFRAPLVVAETA